MIKVSTIAETRRRVRTARASGKFVGFVPTMGALHAGHWSLVRLAKTRCDYVVVSVFVNPTQFGPGEDLAKYPRSLDADLAGCAERNVDLVFVPDVQEMYPAGSQTTVAVRALSRPLCGRSRPGHFDGVTTVVAKLLNIVSPDAAFFGEKDYQQLVVVRRMVEDLDLPVEIVACPTIREEDGLAVSSRNQYLTAGQRRQATCLHRALCQAAEAVRAGEKDAARLIGRMRETILASGPSDIDYISIVDPETLEDVTVVDRRIRACVAVRIGECRLIDNIAVDVRGSGK